MCDNLVVLGNSTEDGSVIFGKNSDREPNEAHAICYIPGKTHNKGEMIDCQYISIPQVQKTHATILSKPAWLKIGAEMGANEHGLVIGNEAVFTKEPRKEIGLLGMDLVTLALQRCNTSKEALNTITSLIEKHCQGGSGSRTDPNDIYDNTFIIVDLKSAWILETAGNFWVAKRVNDVGSISNGLTIQDKWDMASPNLVENAIEKGWCESKSEFNFTECYSDQSFRALSGGLIRQPLTFESLLDNKGNINVQMMMKFLRTHEKKFDGRSFQPVKASMGGVCMHASVKAVSQTTGSYIAHLFDDFQVHWLTGTSAPCISIFKPFFFKSKKALSELKIPDIKNDDVSLWWIHEKLHRLTLLDYPTRSKIIIRRNFELEADLLYEVETLLKSKKFDDNEKLNKISTEALNNNFIIIKDLIKTISNIDILKPTSKSYTKFWAKLSKIDELKFN